jgi:hypothetical protein
LGGVGGWKGSEWRKDEYEIRKGWSQIITKIRGKRVKGKSNGMRKCSVEDIARGGRRK